MRAIGALLASLAVLGCAIDSDGEDRFPTSEDYPPGVMERIDLSAGDGLPWRLSALRAGSSTAPWRVVIVTGTPSWSEYWAPTLAAGGADRAMIVADRPGFAESEPQGAVTEIIVQARALTALIDATPETQRIVLLGQSYGAPVATMLAALRPDRVEALVLMSPFFGDAGPTARRLMGLGAVARPLLPRDLRNALAEVRGQAAQLPAVRETLFQLTIPVVVVHGADDDFTPGSSARALADSVGGVFREVPDGDHFLNACCVDAVLEAVDAAIAAAEARSPPAAAETPQAADPVALPTP